MHLMTWPEVLEGLRLNQIGLTAGALIAVVCSTIGLYVVLKRIVFVGVSLAQMSGAGVSLAFLLIPVFPLAGNHPLAVSLVVTLVGVLLYAQHGGSRRVPRDSAIGIGYLVAAALMLIFIVQSPKGLEEARDLLDGNIVALLDRDLVSVAVLSGVVLAVHVAFHRQFLFTSFDPEMAATQGFRVRAWELLLYLTLGLTIAASIQYAGLLAVFAYMVMPPVTGLCVASRMRAVLAVAVLTAVFSTVAGFALALKLDLPTSPPTIAVMALVLGVAWLTSRLRGAAA
ncbi:MAG TPA: metal ABC transporter permease [Chthonomonadales bacterium]|nr:metal ABC transporter permease [Chthonomonadales bacterium]